MEMKTILVIIWGVVALCCFVALMASGKGGRISHLWEYVIIALILSALWPAETCIFIIGLPIYYIREQILKHTEKE